MPSVSVGDQFGAWTVTAEVSPTRFTCRCACGVTRDIRIYDLSSGKTLMCRKCSHTVPRKHGAYIDPSLALTHSSWCAMIQRCLNPNNKSYDDYGGRGIGVHPLWRESFEAFYMMVGVRPDANHTLERVDYNQGYVPGNVTWATKSDQTRNKSDNVKLTIDGVTQTVSQWALDSRCTVSKFTIYKRLKRGWQAEKAVFTSSKANGKD